MIHYLKPDLYPMNGDDGVGIFQAGECYNVGQVASGRCWSGGDASSCTQGAQG